jgi:hypothetical protein
VNRQAGDIAMILVTAGRRGRLVRDDATGLSFGGDTEHLAAQVEMYADWARH